MLLWQDFYAGFLGAGLAGAGFLGTGLAGAGLDGTGLAGAGLDGAGLAGLLTGVGAGFTAGGYATKRI